MARKKKALSGSRAEHREEYTRLIGIFDKKYAEAKRHLGQGNCDEAYGAFVWAKSAFDRADVHFADSGSRSGQITSALKRKREQIRKLQNNFWAGCVRLKSR